MGIVPEVFECPFLNKREKFLVRYPLKLVRSVERSYDDVAVRLGYTYSKLVKSKDVKCVCCECAKWLYRFKAENLGVLAR